MTYVALDNVDENVFRVERRAEIESRTVPAADVRRRYQRSLHNLTAVADEIDALHVFDNSGKSFNHVLTMERGHIIMLAASLPRWVELTLGSQIARSRGLDLSSLPVYVPTPHEIVDRREDLGLRAEQSLRILGRSEDGERVLGRCGGGILSVAREVFAKLPRVDDTVSLSRENARDVAQPQERDHGLE